MQKHDTRRGSDTFFNSLLDQYLPRRINEGPWFTAYSHRSLLDRIQHDRIVLPICSLGTPLAELTTLAPLVLPPLYHEAMDSDLKQRILDRIEHCFPFYEGTTARTQFSGQFEIVELEPKRAPSPETPRIAAFSVDTAVEEHGPHIPLATDTIQSYAVLERLSGEIDGFSIAPPVDYGHLTWGLPFGLSIDLTPPIVTEYVKGYVNALLEWCNPDAIYVVDVHGSIVHRNAIQEGIRQSAATRSAFRWLHDPLVEFAGDRGDQHAGGVETALIEYINKELTDPNWWPGRIDELESSQMSLERAVELSPDLPQFIECVETDNLNGIVGHIKNYYDVDADEMMNRMLTVARQDVAALIPES